MPLMPDKQFLFARQPIFDTGKQIVAYELLFRATEEQDNGDHIDGDEATSHVLINAFTEMSIDEVVGGRRAFINFTAHLLINPPPFDPDKLVIEVLETTNITDEICAGIERLKADGFKIALDDFRKDLGINQLVHLADIVKLDVLDLDHGELQEHLNYLRDFPVTLLAEKIETYEMYDHCVELGFELFQGYFLSRPQLVKGRRIAESRVILIKLLQKISQQDVEIPELARTIAADPVLSYKLLRLVNSPMHRPIGPIESLSHAISFLGLDRTRNWTMLISMSNLGDKPAALALATLVRARFCEALAELTGHTDGERCFTAGLLSMLDAYCDAPLVEVLQSLPLSEEMNEALLQHRGSVGFLLATVSRFESAQWDAVDWTGLAEQGVDQAAAETAYLSALKWADEALTAFTDVAP